MNPTEIDPLHVDVEKLAELAQELGGITRLRDFRRLSEMAHAESPPAPEESVLWKARGERRVAPGEARQTWLHLEARTRIALTCQRCLQPLEVALAVERSFRFVRGETEAARLDAESEDDVLASSRSFDLLELLEDELLLSLPLVPRHADCRMPLPQGVADYESLAPADPADVQANPFAVLGALKGSRRGN